MTDTPKPREALTYEDLRRLPIQALIIMPGTGKPAPNTDEYPFDGPMTVFRMKENATRNLIWVEDFSGVENTKGDFPLIELYPADFEKGGSLEGRVFPANDEDMLSAWESIEKSWEEAFQAEEAQHRKNLRAFKAWKRAIVGFRKKTHKA